MSSSENSRGVDRSSSGESGWTAYIASPEGDQDRRKGYGDEDAESDDSMTSDASSGPRYEYGGLEGGWKKKSERENGGKKEQTEKEKEKIKAAKDKGDSAARTKKR